MFARKNTIGGGIGENPKLKHQNCAVNYLSPHKNIFAKVAYVYISVCSTCMCPEDQKPSLLTM